MILKTLILRYPFFPGVFTFYFNAVSANTVVDFLKKKVIWYKNFMEMQWSSIF